jgi:hypothetical protein
VWMNPFVQWLGNCLVLPITHSNIGGFIYVQFTIQFEQLPYVCVDNIRVCRSAKNTSVRPILSVDIF